MGAEPMWRVARRYADAPSAPWMSHFAAALQAFCEAEKLQSTAAAAVRESRATFRVDLAAVTIADDEQWTVVAWDGDAPPTLAVPRHAAEVIIGYRPGEIVEIVDLVAYAASEARLARLDDGEFTHLIAAGFSPRTRTRGYLTFVSRVNPALSDDELTLLSLFAIATGIALDRFG